MRWQRRISPDIKKKPDIPSAVRQAWEGGVTAFLDATTHLYRRSCPSVHRSVGPSVRTYVPSYFEQRIWPFYEGKKSSNDIIINDRMSDDEIVASDVPPRYLIGFGEGVRLSIGEVRQFRQRVNTPLSLIRSNLGR